ncbi:hypothetical protein J40TS1_31870 [Paenibacillus montaniterrae]|uniref:Uncharacterized protein n=1 Tax=Paenibacillus montaniterrae TaxID=429341 RepID=A0A919YQG4_9BACL|nr:hypothetical protein J40TS1_31870 [Paenibacillus montaniterrae]
MLFTYFFWFALFNFAYLISLSHFAIGFRYSFRLIPIFWAIARAYPRSQATYPLDVDTLCTTDTIS